MSQLHASCGGVLLQLSRSFRARHRFAKGTTRRLQAPLTLVRTRLSLCRAARRPRDKSITRRAVRVIARRGRHLDGLIEALLSVDRLRAITHGRGVRVRKLVRRILASLRPLTRRGGVRLLRGTRGSSSKESSKARRPLLISYDIGDGRGPRSRLVLAKDSVLVCQVVCGLIRGTVGCGQMSKAIAMSTGERGGRIILAITSAKGKVSRAFQRRVFRPFFQMSGSEDHRLNNIKLKLTLIHRVIQIRSKGVRIHKGRRNKAAFRIEVEVR